MINTNKETLNAQTNLHNFIRTIQMGIYNIIHDSRIRKKFILLLLADLIFCLATCWPRTVKPPMSGIVLICGYFIFFCLMVMCLVVVGYAPGALEMQRNFARVGFVNSAGEPPYLINREKLEQGVVALTYRCTGFPVSMWVNEQLSIESALNMLIASVHEGKDRRSVTLYCVQPHSAFDMVHWSDNYTNRHEDNLLVLGHGLTGSVIIDINKTPHILIGGNTGSGKTILLQCLLRQAIHQADVVYIADFKGGVDFSGDWKQYAHIITDEQKLFEFLNHFSDELERRKKLFCEKEVANIAEYRSKTGDYMQRIIFACDEIAELLDKTGADKDRKELLSKIEAKISLIARQGRAFGINLFLATQRPDANILTGQIKNNMNIRICGRADTVLSTIIIGDGRAAEQIPHDSQGRFIMEDGTIFQGYYFDGSVNGK